MDRQASMIDLLEHLLGEYWGYFDQEVRPDLLPGEIPNTLPTNIPIPPDSTIVGSAVWPQRRLTTIMFDCNMTPEQVLQFYEQHLPSQGWTKPQTNHPFDRGGFTRANPARDFGTEFCLGDRGLSLHVRSFTLPNHDTAVSVSLNTDPEQSPCSPRMRRQYEELQRFRREMLPELRPPAGATQMGSGGSGSSGADTAQSEAWLKTDLDIPSTLAHYDEQLVNAGWSRSDTGHGGPIAWSSWEFKYEDESWHGMLTVTQRPWTTGEYTLRLYAESEWYGQRGGIRWVSHF